MESSGEIENCSKWNNPLLTLPQTSRHAELKKLRSSGRGIKILKTGVSLF